MQSTRSGLAAAAAEMQLTSSPEGKSSLQIRLDEAEKRAREAEAAARSAQAALARTLLDAARVEAVVTARKTAESEAEIEALRSQLDAAKRAAASCDPRLELPYRTAAHSCDAPIIPRPDVYRPIMLTEWDRPLDLDDDAGARPEGAAAGRPKAVMHGPTRMVLFAVVAIIAFSSYAVTTVFMSDRIPRMEAAAVAGPAVGPTARTNDANWLLYMPVEHAAVARYLGGNTGPKRQLAVTGAPPAVDRN